MPDKESTTRLTTLVIPILLTRSCQARYLQIESRRGRGVSILSYRFPSNDSKRKKTPLAEKNLFCLALSSKIIGLVTFSGKNLGKNTIIQSESKCKPIFISFSFSAMSLRSITHHPLQLRHPLQNHTTIIFNNLFSFMYNYKAFPLNTHELKW